MEFAYNVYVLLCGYGHYYVGCTSDLDARIDRHANGLVQSTKSRSPVTCILAIGFSDTYKAFAFEKYLKTGSGRAFMGRHFV